MHPSPGKGAEERTNTCQITCIAITALLEGTQTPTDDEWDITKTLPLPIGD